MQEIYNQYIGMIDSTSIKVLIMLTIAYFGASCIVAIRQRRFQYAVLTNTLDNSTVPLFGGLLVIAVITVAQPAWQSYISTMWGILDLALLGLIAAKARELGIPIPDIPWIHK